MIIDDIALTMEPSIGPRTAMHLIEIFGSAEGIYSSSVDQLIEKAALRPDIARKIVKKSLHRQAENELRKCEKEEINVVASYMERYPALLKEIHDYPHVLYVKGNIDSINMPCLSVVGTRKVTPYGQKVCEDIIIGLAQSVPGICIVSGLAYGVDAAAHRSALAGNIPTAAVLPNHVGHIYPSQHAGLANQILKQGGCLISEYHSGIKPMAGTFVARNRIIAGISAGTLVVESAVKGGSLITANLANSYYRSVMAIPGRIYDQGSGGTNDLIRSNRAVMVCSVTDIISEMLWDDIKKQDGENKCADLDISNDARALYGHFESGEKYDMDTIAAISGNNISQTIGLIIELELAGALICHPGKIYEKV